MPDNTIVAIAGLGLALWFMSSGSGQVSILDTLVAELKKVAKPFLRVKAEARLIADSWIYRNMRVSVEGWSQSDKWRADFQRMTLQEIEHHVTRQLPEMVQEIKRMETMYGVAVVDVLRDVHIDGPFQFKNLQQMEPVKHFIELNYSLFKKWGEFIRQLLLTLPNATTEDVDRILEPFHDALRK